MFLQFRDLFAEVYASKHFAAATTALTLTQSSSDGSHPPIKKNLKQIKGSILELSWLPSSPTLLLEIFLTPKADNEDDTLAADDAGQEQAEEIKNKRLSTEMLLLSFPVLMMTFFLFVLYLCF